MKIAKSDRRQVKLLNTFLPRSILSSFALIWFVVEPKHSDRMYSILSFSSQNLYFCDPPFSHKTMNL